MKIFIVAGGTGGHVYPALSVAREFKKNTAKIFWVGRQKSLEEDVAKEENFNFLPLYVSGFLGKKISGKIRAVFNLCFAFIKSLALLIKFKPDVIFSTGGYISLPVGLAAPFLRIPLFIHEQNSVAGLSNRILNIISKATFEGFPDTFKTTNKTKFVGNPLRDELFIETQDRKGIDKEFNILVLGGSQGSSQLNKIFIKALEASSNSLDWNIVHQAGSVEFNSLKKRYSDLPIKHEVLQYIKNIGQEYQKADLVISRSGAMTVSEISAFGKAAILMPLPWATDNHQYYNALYLKNLDGAEIVESDLDNYKFLLERILNIEKDTKRRIQMGLNAKKAFSSSSVTDIYKFINEKI
jgi:UDP-N-acetylglucosamine--N-acetylmuramyl-(pentapeptide) pyrophosphoryl-undecaprenol N-acetylglucosamine transferase